MGDEYQVLGQTIDLDVDPSVVAVRFEDTQPKSLWAKATEAAGIGPLARRFEPVMTPPAAVDVTLM